MTKAEENRFMDQPEIPSPLKAHLTVYGRDIGIAILGYCIIGDWGGIILRRWKVNVD